MNKLVKLEYLQIYIEVNKHCSALVKDCFVAIEKETGKCKLLLDRYKLQAIKNVARKYM